MAPVGVTDDRRAHLQAWYRDALSRRAGTLETLVAGVADGRPEARRQVRDIAHALAGSGGTFGFPVVGDGARVVASRRDERLLPRVLGLIDLLRDVARDEPAGPRRAGRWLVYAAGPLPDPPEGGAVPPDLELHEAWRRVATRLGLDEEGLATRVATRLGVEVADPASATPGAALVVPAALVLEHGFLPLHEDGVRIVVATANPTDLRAMAALEATTGRMAVLDLVPPEPLEEALEARYAGAPRAGSAPRARPPTEPPSPTPRAPVTPEGRSPSATVLVVDDEPEARLLCRTVLEREGLRVVEARGGEEALTILSTEQEIDVALVDVLMPDLGGRELLESIRRHPARADLPVIVLTGLQAPGNEVQLMERGADDYLRKPVEPRVLLARIGAVLRRSGTARAP